MLSQLLQELKSRPGVPVTLQDLSRKLGVDASVVSGMLRQLEQRGSLRTVGSKSEACCVTEAAPDCGHCSPAAGGCDACPFVVSMPNSQEIRFMD